MLNKIVIKIFEVLPTTLKNYMRAIYYSIPFTKGDGYDPEFQYKSTDLELRKWVNDVYTKHGSEQRRSILLSISRFCHINRPITGYYFEFGCHEANTIRMAYDSFRHLHDLTYVAFDSFEGLPEISKIDKQDIWNKGKLKTSEEEFISIVTCHGIPKEKLITVKGFYKDSLSLKLKEKLLPTKAAVVYIDCDLYASTVSVLKFVKDFLQRGTIVVFDDWNCFYGDNNKGERKAFREFQLSEPDLIFEEFAQTSELKAFMFTGSRSE